MPGPGTLEAENDTPNRYKLSKQADAVMLFYVFAREELAAILGRLGYELRPEQADVEVVEPSPREVAEGDHPELARIAFRFDRRHFGQLRQLIDRLNELVSEGEHAAPGEAFTEAHTERDW